MRDGTLRAVPRTQSSIAVCGADRTHWTLVNVSPDILVQLRARSGGIQVSPASVGVGAAGERDAVRRLQEAKQMLDERLITDAEYEAIKAKIFSS